MSAIKYRPEIDGLRAVAILPVLLFHYDENLLPGGYLGVDVFFVISGFLITSIILKETDQGDFKFSNFWLRRVRRILPALTVMVMATLVIGIQILYAADRNSLGNHGLASLLSFANISHWLMAGNYWGPSAESSPFLHAWSLSVEEQFYLFFPVLMYLVIKYVKSHVILIFSLLSLASFVLFVLCSKIYSSATFYLLPTRAWELGVGALLAIYSNQHQYTKIINQHSYLSVCGLLAIFISYFLLSGRDGISPLIFIPVIGSALIIACTGHTGGIVNKLLSNKFAVYVGKISYSLYLWHWPILVYYEQLYISWNYELNPFFLFLLIFIVSALSYQFIELPTRRNKRFTPYILLTLCAVTGFSFYLMKGEFTEDTSAYSEVYWHGELYNVNPNKDWPESVRKRMTGITVPREEENREDQFTQGINKSYGSGKPEILVLGNSHALMWAKVLDEAAETLNASISFYTADGTPTFFNIPPEKSKTPEIFFTAEEKYKFDLARYNAIQIRKPEVVVIADPWYTQRIEDTEALIQFIEKLDLKVLLIEQPPVLYFGDKNAPQYLSYLGVVPGPPQQFIRYIESDLFTQGNKLVKELVKRYPSCISVPIADLFIDDDQVLVLENDRVLYIDDDHLSYHGALKAKDRITKSLQDLLSL